MLKENRKQLSEAAFHVILGAFIFRPGKDVFIWCGFDQLTLQKESCKIG